MLCFWATWCTPCVTELGALAQSADRLSAAGVDLLLLSVDGLDRTQASTSEDAFVLLEQLAIPFASGGATRETVDKLALIEQIVLSRETPFAVPYSVLVDAEGLVSALYRGTMNVDEMLQDVQRLNSSANSRRDHAVPFPGRWLTAPKMMLLRPVADVFRQHGYVADAQRFRELELDLLQRRRRQARSVEEAAAVERQYAQACDDLGRLAEARGELMEAMVYYRAALVITPQAVAVRFRLASLLRQEGQHSEAIQELKHVIEQDSRHVSARIELSKAYLANQEATSAVDAAQAALALVPERVDVRFQLGVAQLAARQPELATAAFKQALEADPEHVDSLINLGAISAASGATSEAIAYLERAVELSPESADALMNLGGVLGSTGQFVRAATCFERVLASDSSSAPAHARLAQAQMAQGQTHQALRHFERALELNPDDRASMHRLAWIRATARDADLRDGRRALELAQKLAEASGRRDPRVLDALAAAYAELGEFPQAVAVGEEALRLVPPTHPLQSVIAARIEQYRQRVAFRE